MARKLRKRRDGSSPVRRATRAPSLSEEYFATKPRLLVSVRDVAEAVAALQGGAAIIDVKEPDHGALGRATADVQRDIVRIVRRTAPSARVTAALGDLLLEEDPASVELPRGIALFKLGFAGWARRRGWEAALEKWLSRVTARSSALAVVAYADHELARSPAPLDVLRFAATRRLQFLLLDTHTKGAGSLRSLLGDREIKAYVDAARVLGIRLALAGSLREEDMAPMAALGPDVIAVRGAACAQGVRERTIDPERVARLALRISSRKRRLA